MVDLHRKLFLMLYLPTLLGIWVPDHLTRNITWQSPTQNPTIIHVVTLHIYICIWNHGCFHFLVFSFGVCSTSHLCHLILLIYNHVSVVSTPLLLKSYLANLHISQSYPSLSPLSYIPLLCFVLPRITTIYLMYR